METANQNGTIDNGEANKGTIRKGGRTDVISSNRTRDNEEQNTEATKCEENLQASVLHYSSHATVTIFCGPVFMARVTQVFRGVIPFSSPPRTMKNLGKRT